MAETELFERVGKFISALEHLSTGERASLKWEAGKRLPEASGSALAAFYRTLPEGIGVSLEGKFFAVACLNCLWKSAQLSGAKRPYETCLKQIRAKGYESFDKRVNALLDCYWDDDDGYLQAKLCRVTKQMRQQELLPDFRRLLLDLIGWNAPERRVQRRWARVYYGELEVTSTHTNVKEEEGNAI